MSRDAEHVEQSLLIQWAEHASGRHPELKLLFAIPNGGHRHKAVAGKLKAEGVRRGVPDLCLPVARKGWHALYIELKAPKGRVKPEQVVWLRALREHGNCTTTAFGWERAREVIEDYLALPPYSLTE